MTGVLIIAEHRQGKIRDVTRELVTAAGALGEPVAVAVIAADPVALRSQVNVSGVDEIIEMRVATAEFENDVYRSAVAHLIETRRPDAVLTGFTVDSMGYAAALAVRLRLGFASDVFALSREDEQILACRAMYGGKVHAALEMPIGHPAILMIRPTTWAAADGNGKATVTECVLPDPVVSRARHVQFEPISKPDVDITTANFLLSIGRGVDTKENVPIFESLAGKMSATLSASRPLIDSGWLPADRQVGQSGKTVKPKVYLALGISGAVQHLAGMKSSETIIAVNLDPDASIFGVAHYGAVADLFEVVAELEKLYP